MSVCNQTCEVTSVTSLQLRCTAPSLLLYSSGLHGLNLTNATEAEYDLGYAPPPPPPPGVPALVERADTITVRNGKIVAMRFNGLNDSALPRGSSLSNVALRVVPQTGASGAVVLEVRASLYCGVGPAPLSAAELAMYNQTNATVEWDMQPYGLGFAADEDGP